MTNEINSLTTTSLEYDALYPQIDTLEIQSDQILFEQQQVSGFLFQPSQVQAEPQISSLEIKTPEVPIGEIIPSVDAVGWHQKGFRNVDIRPRLVDSASGEARLIDSGAQLSAAKKRPEDKLDIRLTS